MLLSVAGLGVIGNLAASLWVLQSKPFRSELCNSAALTALLQLLMTFVSAFLFLDDPSAQSSIDLSTWTGSLLVAVNCCCFVVIAAGALRDIWTERMLVKSRRLRHSADHAEVDPPPIRRGEFHLFLSHTWAQGEEAMRTIKLRLTDMMPSASIFLDKVGQRSAVLALTLFAQTNQSRNPSFSLSPCRLLQDDLKKGAGAEYVAKSKSVLIFCTFKYFQSRACARELILSVLYGKPLIAVIEPDASRGGLTHAAVVHLLLEVRHPPA